MVQNPVKLLTLFIAAMLLATPLYAQSDFTVNPPIKFKGADFARGPGGRIDLANSSSGAVRHINSPATTDTVLSSDGTVQWDSTALADKLENLPACTSANSGESHRVVDGAGTAPSYPISVSPPLGSTINGQSTYPIALSRGAVWIACDGISNWIILSAGIPGAGSGALTPNNDLNVCNFASCSDKTTTGTVPLGGTTLVMASSLDFPRGCAGISSGGCDLDIAGAGATPTIGSPTGFALASYCPTQSPVGNTTIGMQTITGVFPIAGIYAGETIIAAGVLSPGTTILAYNQDLQEILVSSPALVTSSASTFTATDACNATEHYAIASYDQQGGITTPQLFSTTTAPTHISTWNVVCMTWTAASGSPSGYVIWKSDDGVTWHFFQVATGVGAGSCQSGVNGPLWDGGQPLAPRPWWIPDDPTTIASGQNDWLAATIVSGGGTPTIKIAPAALNAVTNARVQHDDTGAYLSWLGLLNSANGSLGGVIPASASLRVRTGGAVTVSAPIAAEPGARILPFGAAVGSVLSFGQPITGTTVNGANNLQESSSCVPINPSGYNVGDYLLIQQQGPGGPSQSVPYTLLSRIVSLSCQTAILGLRIADPAGVTFTNLNRTETATISGTPVAGSTLRVSLNGDAACVANYTVVAGDTLITIARNLALAGCYSSSANVGPVATTTGAVITYQLPDVVGTASWSQSVTNVGGGTLAIALTAGTPYTIQHVNSGVTLHTGVSGLTIDAIDATGNTTDALVGVNPTGTCESLYQHLILVNFTGSASGFYGYENCHNIYDDIVLDKASGGTPNIISYSDFWLYADTGSLVSNIKSTEPLSFGVQFTSSSNLSVVNIHSQSAFYGRQLKLCGTVASRFDNIDTEGGVFDNLALACGTYRNTFNNIRTANAYGFNDGGIVMFDSWDRFNTFTNFKSGGSLYNLSVGLSDIYNTFTNGDLGTGGGFPPGVVSRGVGTVFVNTNLCQYAVSDPSGTVMCRDNSNSTAYLRAASVGFGGL